MKKTKDKENRGVRFLAGPAGFLSFGLFFASLFILGGPEYPLAVGAALLFHEAGHFAAAALTGARLTALEVGVWGIRTVYDYSDVSPARETTVLLAGPACNAASAFFALRTTVPEYRGGMYFILSCIALAVLNLLPVDGLDGGAALYAAVARFALPDSAERVCSAVSAAFVALFWVLSAFVQLTRGINYSLLFLSVYFLARSERKSREWTARR